MSQTKRTPWVGWPREGPPQVDLQPSDSSGTIIQVRFGVSSLSTSHKILWLWIHGLQHLDLTIPPRDVQTAKRPKSILPALLLLKKVGMGWRGMGWDGSLPPSCLDQLPRMLIRADATGAAERGRCLTERFGVESLELKVIPQHHPETIPENFIFSCWKNNRNF